MKLSQWILFFSGVLSAMIISTAYQAPIVAQGVDLSTEPLSTEPLSTEPLSTEPLSTDLVRTPSMVMMPTAGSVSVEIVNQTSEDIAYQALGDTEPRILAANATTTLQRLHVPATVTFVYKNIQKDRAAGSGLTKVELRASEDKTHLNLIVQPTDSLDADVSNLTVESNGNVFVF